MGEFKLRKTGEKQVKLGQAFVSKNYVSLYLFGSWVVGPPKEQKQRTKRVKK